MTRMVRSLGALLALSCASPPDGEPLLQRGAAITHASEDSVHEAVVALEREGNVVCSGALILPDVVATAAHCVTVEGVDQVALGAVIDHTSSRFPIRRTFLHPEFDPDDLTADLALVVLGEPLPLAPLQHAFGSSSGVSEAASVTLVGFGATGPLDLQTGRRRAGTATVERVRTDTFDVTPSPSSACGGDSGGAALVELGGAVVLAGVVSAGDLHCERLARIVRFDTNGHALLAELDTEPEAAATCALGRPSPSPSRLAFSLACGFVLACVRRATKSATTES